MQEIENIVCLIKFGKKEHLEKLLTDGEIYFNLPTNFNNLSKINKQKGDLYEGAEWILNEEIERIEVKHPILGNFEFKTDKSFLPKLIQFNPFFLSYSLYIISPSIFNNHKVYNIDSEMLEFGDSAVMINNPKQFLNSIFSILKENNLKYQANIVEYKNLNNKGKVDMTPFIKKTEHSHQREFRIIIENVDNIPKLIKIGSVKDYCRLVSAESMIEAVWSIKKGK